MSKFHVADDEIEEVSATDGARVASLRLSDPSLTVNLDPVAIRAFRGQEVSGQVPDIHETSALGEAIAIAHLRRRLANVKKVNGSGHAAIDAVADAYGVEIKAGAVTNSQGAWQWRLTIGEPGQAEAVFLAAASDEDKLAYNRTKAAAIRARKDALLAELSGRLGTELRPRTVTVIIDHAQRLADVFEFDGFHHRIGWTSDQASRGYAGTYRFTVPALTARERLLARVRERGALHLGPRVDKEGRERRAKEDAPFAGDAIDLSPAALALGPRIGKDGDSPPPSAGAEPVVRERPERPPAQRGIDGLGIEVDDASEWDIDLADPDAEERLAALVPEEAEAPEDGTDLSARVDKEGRERWPLQEKSERSSSGPVIKVKVAARVAGERATPKETAEAEHLVALAVKGLPATWLGRATVDDKIIELHLGPTGREVTLSLDVYTRNELRLELLKVKPELQGQGIGRVIASNLVEVAKAGGRTRIGLEAALTDGAYVWARMGFTVDRPGDLVEKLEDRLDQIKDPKVRASVEAVIAKHAKDPALARRLADLRFGQVNIGRLLLTNRPSTGYYKQIRWEGRLDFRDRAAMQRFRKYTSRKNLTDAAEPARVDLRPRVDPAGLPYREKLTYLLGARYPGGKYPSEVEAEESDAGRAKAERTTKGPRLFEPPEDFDPEIEYDEAGRMVAPAQPKFAPRPPGPWDKNLSYREKLADLAGGWRERGDPGVVEVPDDLEVPETLSFRDKLALLALGPRIGKDGTERWAAREPGTRQARAVPRHKDTDTDEDRGGTREGSATALTEAAVARVRDLPGAQRGVNLAQIVTLTSGEEAFFKPEHGERWPDTVRPGGKFPASIVRADGSKALREELAFKVDDAIGTDLAPVTVLREVLGESGSLSTFVKGGKTWAEVGHSSDAPATDWYRLAVLDLVIGNTDRKPTNLMVKKGRLVAIDNNGAFPRDNSNFKWSLTPTSFGAPKALRERLAKNISNTDWDRMLNSLGTPAVRALKRRAAEVQEALESDTVQALLQKRLAKE